VSGFKESNTAIRKAPDKGKLKREDLTKSYNQLALPKSVIINPAKQP